jgi:hypothetical protein
MAKKKTNRSVLKIPLSPAFPAPGEWDFDSLEEKIRGEEIILAAEQKLSKEENDIRKKLNETEIDRRLKSLRDKIKPPKK